MSIIYLDVICLVTSHSHHEHLQNLQEVLQHLEETRMQLKEEKYVFLMSDVITESEGSCGEDAPELGEWQSLDRYWVASY